MDWLICTQSFVDVVETNSFAAAARKQNLNSPAVSKRVQWLERQLGVQLLKRSTRNLALTEAGERFYRQGRLQLEQWRGLIEETASVYQEPQGILRIGATLALGSRLVSDVLDKFLTRYPGFKVQLINLERGQVPDLVLDLYISRELEQFDSPHFRSRSLFSYQGEFFAAPDYVARHGDPQTVEELPRHHHLLFHDALERTFDFANGQRVHLQGRLCSTNPEALLFAAIQGMGLILTSRFMIRRELARGELVAVMPGLQTVPVKINAYYPKLEFTHARTQLFLDFLREEFG